MGYLTDLSAVQERGGGLRLVGPDETVVSKDYCKQAQDNLTTIWNLRREVSSEREKRQVAERKAQTYQERSTEVQAAFNTESERSSNWARECGLARKAHREAQASIQKQTLATRTAEIAAENLKAENADLKDLLKQVTEYAIVASGTASRIRPEDGVRSLGFKLGDAPHLNIEIEDGAMVRDRKRIKVWAPAPPNPDGPILSALRSRYPVSAEVVLGHVRDAGLDIILKDQSKGVTMAVTSSLKSVS